MDYMFKLILFGDGGVGKTTLCERYVNGSFIANTQVTIGVKFLFKRLKLNNDVFNLQIWDLGGEDRFRFIFPGYCNKANGGIYVFDVTSPRSLYNIRDWMQIVNERKASFPVILVGTKTDLTPQRLVKRTEEKDIAREFNIPDVVEISSKTGRNVDFAFETLSKLIVKSLMPIPPIGTNPPRDTNQPVSAKSPKRATTTKRVKPTKRTKSLSSPNPRIWV